MSSKVCPITEVCARVAMRPVATITVATCVVCCTERGRSVTFDMPSAFQSVTTTVCMFTMCNIYAFKIGSVTHLHIKWRAWLNAIG